MNNVIRICAALCAGLLIAGCAGGGKEESSNPTDIHYSGYLGDYKGLEKVKTESGAEAARWVNPKLKKGQYTKIIVDPIVFYPAPQPGPNVTIQALYEIVAYSNKAEKREVSKVMKLVDRAGPGVLRLRVAMTGVKKQKEGMSALNYTPIGLLFVGAQEATGTRPEEGVIVWEGELIDSETGERMAMGVRKQEVKKKLEAGQKLTLDLMKPAIDKGAETLREIIARNVK